MNNHKKGFFNNLLQKVKSLFGKKKPIKVYFVSGMCNPCSVFDEIVLPEGYEKVYIEWLIPYEGESLNDYARRMAEDIDTAQPFVLAGYSFGAVIIQEMNKFLTPQRNIIMASMKSSEEIPTLFKVAKRAHFVGFVPKSVFGATKFVTNVFSRILFDMPPEQVAALMVHTDPVYVRWAVDQITQWQPESESPNTYHIHGTKDQIFPYKQIKMPYTIEEADHLMPVTHAREVSRYLAEIFAIKQ
ncbi:alpha/beta hydrolase [Dysgonomonas sp. 25]|uniref:alpha/beta hydrolase n=1 Tax=Dysgonomonas sp. 25 TaxID=2302933 RepID=UPI0013D80A3A|nr:alpha/beta hydrolase [Dysgonomonas sp. 25]NDV67603.1 alpha/beta hydrolase [Dysgonomonas sp. 25]